MKYLTILVTLTITTYSCSSPENKEADNTTGSPIKEIPSSQTDNITPIASKSETDTIETPNNQGEESPSSKIDTEESTTEIEVIPETIASVNTTKEKISTKSEDDTPPEQLTVKTVEKTPIHSTYNSLLSKYVSNNGAVNYVGLKKEHGSLKQYIESLKKLNYKTLSKNDQLAFLINFYNALTLDLILKNYPIKSITDLPKAWDTPRVTYQGKSLTLNDIEHKLIRENFKEPRIHFACNCAAVSCPKLLNKAYEGATLEKHLDSQTKQFLNNSSKNQLSTNSIKVSKIFEWYATDFGNVTTFIKKYHPEVNSNAKLSYLEYDWALNRQ